LKCIISIKELYSNTFKKLLHVCKNENVTDYETWMLLETITEQDKVCLLLKKSISLSKKRLQKLRDAINLRVIEQKPMEYIIEYTPFLNATIYLKPPILIPRPETEEMVDWTINTIKNSKDQLNILDMCTGTGCIAIALAQAFPQHHITAIDVNITAIELAQHNAKINKVTNLSFVLSDLFSNIKPDNQFDLIISNPPYISDKEYKMLSQEVTKWEDKNALVARHNGNFFYKQILQYAHRFLIKEKNTYPKIILEIGNNNIKTIAKKYGWKNIFAHKDICNKSRWISIQ
jgi:release factor glutamine methyltransferase